MDTINQLDSSVLSELFQDSAPSLIPESLITTITTGFIVLSILGALFLVLYLFTVIRKWKVDSAILQMQKDIAEIKIQGITRTEHIGTDSTPINQEKL